MTRKEQSAQIEKTVTHLISNKKLINISYIKSTCKKHDISNCFKIVFSIITDSEERIYSDRDIFKRTVLGTSAKRHKITLN
jgi:hypothetical protein